MEMSKLRTILEHGRHAVVLDNLSELDMDKGCQTCQVNAARVSQGGSPLDAVLEHDAQDLDVVAMLEDPADVELGRDVQERDEGGELVVQDKL